jgi:hypothetical protein
MTHRVGDIHSGPLASKLQVASAIVVWELGFVRFALGTSDELWGSLRLQLENKLDQNPLNVLLLVNLNCLGESIPCDVQTNIYLRVSLSDAKSTLHLTKM